MQLACISACRDLYHRAPRRRIKGRRLQQTLPKASFVAAPLQQHVPAPAGAPREASPALLCPRTATPCAALTGLFGTLTPAGDEAQAWVQALAPCAHCRVASKHGCDGLRRVRLGQREREVLIAAAESGTFVLTEPGMTRSLSAARRRAAQSLGKAGLVAPVARPAGIATPAGAGPQRATIALTSLGHYVMGAYGRFIRAGKPIRWTRPARGVALPGRDPALLRDEVLASTETALRETLSDLKGVLIAAITKPQKDPLMLDSVTRHLEQKATLLKAVLAPSRGPSGAAER